MYVNNNECIINLPLLKKIFLNLQNNNNTNELLL